MPNLGAVLQYWSYTILEYCAQVWAGLFYWELEYLYNPLHLGSECCISRVSRSRVAYFSYASVWRISHTLVCGVFLICHAREWRIH